MFGSQSAMLALGYNESIRYGIARSVFPSTAAQNIFFLLKTQWKYNGLLFNLEKINKI